ncbi:MAG: transposase [Proteobacteria bacterium]|nr:transposase [Pseudomonadota bacterium]
MELTDIIVTTARQCGEATQVICGMESTGNFHKRLEYTLRCEERLELQVHVINPMAVKNFGKVLLKDSKTDKGDSWLIARYLSSLRPGPDFQPTADFEEFKEATRTRRSLIEERTQSKNRLHKLLRYHFPGYGKILGKELTKQLLVAIRDMPSPDKILSKSVEEIATLSTAKGHYINLDFAQKLQKLAQEAPNRCLADTTCILLQITARRILDLYTDIAELDLAIKKMLDELYPDQHLTSIPGIGEAAQVAVGMLITEHPPHRSQRALLTHWAPALGSDAQALARIRV